MKGGIIILSSHKIKKILEAPKKMEIGLGDIKVEYWSVLCEMENSIGVTYESSVTFDNLADALEIKIGDTFFR
ncbi:hypothetical protein NSQ62_08375 [Solibacillus sp. FSL H8-0523]|uniref:hypothetical protein n=1 Tax=Solibacillus sp. FSL H8-0523 TaxID=2954511 RepID=UPI003100DE0D